MKEYMKQRRKDATLKKMRLIEKNHIIQITKIQIHKNLKNRGKKPLRHTENQILRRLRNHVKKPLIITRMPIRKKIKNLEREQLWHTEN